MSTSRGDCPEKERDSESHVKVSAVSDAGDVAEFYLKHVRIKSQGPVFVKPDGEEK